MSSIKGLDSQGRGAKEKSVQKFKVGDRVRLSEVEWNVPTDSRPGEVGVVERVYPASNTYPYEVCWPSAPGTEVFTPGELELAPVEQDAEEPEPCWACNCHEPCGKFYTEDGPYSGEGEVPPEGTLQRIKETLERIEANLPKPVEVNHGTERQVYMPEPTQEIKLLNDLLDKAEAHNEELADRNRILRAKNEALHEELERVQKEVWKLAPKALGWY